MQHRDVAVTTASGKCLHTQSEGCISYWETLYAFTIRLDSCIVKYFLDKGWNGEQAAEH